MKPLIVTYVLLAVVTISLAGVQLLHIRRVLRRSAEVRRESPPPPGTIPANSIFHKPLNADCPIGTKLLAGYFSEADGSKQDACHNPLGDGSIDYLNPGEGCSIPIFIAPPESTEPKV